MIRKLLPILGITFIDIVGFSMLIPMLPYFVTHFGASAYVVGSADGDVLVLPVRLGAAVGQRLRPDRPQDGADRQPDRRDDRLGDARPRAEHRGGARGRADRRRLRRAHPRGHLGRKHQHHAGLRRRSRRAARARARVRADRRDVRGRHGLRPVRAAAFSTRILASRRRFLVAAGLQLVTLLLTITMLPESRARDKDDEARRHGRALARASASRGSRRLLCRSSRSRSRCTDGSRSSRSTSRASSASRSRRPTISSRSSPSSTSS